MFGVGPASVRGGGNVVVHVSRLHAVSSSEMINDFVIHTHTHTHSAPPPNGKQSGRGYFTAISTHEELVAMC